MIGGEPRRLRSALRRLTSPYVIGWPLFWTSYVVFVLDGFPVFFGAPLDGVGLRQPLRMIAFATVNQIVLFAILLLARHTVLRLPAARRHPGWTIWTFLFAGLIGDAVGSSIFGWASPTSVGDPDTSLVDHGFFTTMALCLLGVMVVALREHRETVTSLQAAQGRLLETRARASLALESERGDALARVIPLVRAAVGKLSAERPLEAVRDLRLAAQDVVRPLSHSLATLPPDFVATPPPVVTPPSWRRLFAEVGVAPLVSPNLLGLTLTVLSLRNTVTAAPVANAHAQIVLQFGPLSVSADFIRLFEVVFEHVGVFASTWVAAALTRRVLGRILPRRTVSSQWLIIGAAIIFATGLGELVMSLAYRLPGMPAETYLSPWVRALIVVPVSLVTFLVGLNRAIARRRSLLRTELIRINQDLMWEVAKTNEMLWQERRELSRTLHGPLQAALNAGAIQLDAAVRAGSVTSQMVGDAAAAIERALDSLNDRGRGAVDFNHEMRLLRSTWDGVCEVTLEADGRIRERLAADQLCAGVLVDIVGEAVANAALHGQANRVGIRLTPGGDRLLRLTVQDNGTALRPSGSDGLGTAILAEVTTDWDLDFGESGATLVATLPLEELAVERLDIGAAAEPSTPNRVDVLP